MKKTLLRYLHRPQIRQHSEEWHQIRGKLITATKVSGYLESSPYGPKLERSRSKAGAGTGTGTNGGAGTGSKVPKVSPNPAMAFGTLHEEPARKALEKRFKTRIYDLGLGIHEKHTWLGASPDGIAVLADGTVNLIEIKCPYYRKITRKIPFDYWVQMQIQMEVWDVDGCIYSENLFSKPGSSGSPGSGEQIGILQSYWDIKVSRDREWFERILPILKQNKQQLTEKKKLFWTKAVDMYRIRNWFMSDPLLDWLDRWSGLDRDRYSRDSPKKYDLAQFASKQTKLLHRTILDELVASKGEDAIVDISRVWFEQFSPTAPNWEEKILRPPVYKSFGKHRITMQAIQSGCPVIADGILLDEKNQCWGKADLLVREDVLEHLFLRGDDSGMGIKIGPDPKIWSNKPGARYHVVLTRFSSLNLTADGIHMLNNGKQKLYKAYVRFLTNCLPKDRQTTTGYVVGRKASWTSRNVKYQRDGWSQSRGLISLDDRDAKYATSLSECLTWLSRLEEEGHDWRPEASELVLPENTNSSTTSKKKRNSPSKNKRKREGDEGEEQKRKKPYRILELCPNMKNKNDHPWHGYKKRLAKQSEEITQVLNIGPEKRDAMIIEGGLRSWKDIRTEHLEKFKVSSKDCVNNILRSNRDNVMIGLKGVCKELPCQAPVEFYFDFETVSDLNERVGQELFNTSPGIGGQSNIIYMIGCYVRDTRTGEHEYLNYLVDEIDPENERKILTEWINDLRLIMAKHNSHYQEGEGDREGDGEGFEPVSHRTRGGSAVKRRRTTTAITTTTDKAKNPRLQMPLYHWSPAELIQLRRAAKAYGSLVTDFLAEAQFIDLCAVLKNNKVGIPGAFGYGLKSVAKSLHGLGKIESTWEENMNGADAMVAAWYLKYRSDHEQHGLIEPERILANPDRKPQKKADALAKEIIIYNYYDCKVMDEIVEFIRDYK